jgi:hypothetical protein
MNSSSIGSVSDLVSKVVKKHDMGKFYRENMIRRIIMAM